jgi:hypothetical protein
MTEYRNKRMYRYDLIVPMCVIISFFSQTFYFWASPDEGYSRNASCAFDEEDSYISASIGKFNANSTHLINYPITLPIPGLDAFNFECQEQQGDRICVCLRHAYCVQWCLCLWIVHSWLLLRFFFLSNVYIYAGPEANTLVVSSIHDIWRNWLLLTPAILKGQHNIVFTQILQWKSHKI